MPLNAAPGVSLVKSFWKIMAFVAGISVAAAALAQSYPAKPIRLLFAQAPGSTTDVVSRVVGNRLAESLGQPLVVEARPGAGGALGTELAAKSAPDGYTLFMGNNSTHGANPALYANLPYDPVKDFAPISFIASVPYVLVINPSLQVASATELVAFVKSRGGRVNYASAGIGSAHHFSGELLKSMAGLDMTHVPYKGSAPAIAALLAGEVSLMFANAADIGPQIKGGKVKPLAVTVPKRSSQLPDVPTMAEQGFTGFEVQSWFGLLAPAGLPRPLVTRLNGEMHKALAAADVKSTLGAQGLEIAPGTPEQFADFIKAEIARFTRIAKTAGIKAE
jgi:tripartite-type tricarboxylate transporter receptor subunit TctC